MTVTEPFDAKKVANEIRSYAKAAVGDVAACVIADPELDDKWGPIYKRLKRRVQDAHGALADQMYSDPDCLSDLIGDKLHDECSGDRVKMQKVLEVLKSWKGTWAKAAAVLEDLV